MARSNTNNVGSVVISNGHNKFHLARAAVEANKRNILDVYITGGYPTKRMKEWLLLMGLDSYPAVQRLLKREEHIPQRVIHPMWLSEIISQLGLWIRRSLGAGSLSESIFDYSLRLYAYQAVQILKKASFAKVYHYRAGYGHRSVTEAKHRGMIALCDHTIAHPAVVEYLVSNHGRLPTNGSSIPIGRFWLNIRKDIDRADYVLVNSAFVKETFIHQGWDPSRIYVIYLGIDDEFLESVPLRHYDYEPHKSLKLIFAGEFGHRKGGDVLARALQRLGDIDWQLEIAGGIDAMMKVQLNSFLRDPRVKIMGALPRSRLAECLSEADVLVFPSLAEGSARVIFEALVCGCYVITTPNSGSVVEDGVHGTLIRPGDADGLEKAIRKAANDREAIARIGQNNADVIRKSFRQSHYGDSLFQLYERLLVLRH